MKFIVRWLEEKSAAIEASDVKDAEKYILSRINCQGSEPTAKLLSIHSLQPRPPNTPVPVKAVA